MKGQLRCDRCNQAPEACICHLLTSIAVRTRMLVLVHHIEARKTTNTGRLAALALGARLGLWGDREADPPAMPDGPVLLLFPSDDARPIEARDAERGATLVVPDGTWRQARRMARRVESLCEGRVERVRVEGGSSAYQLRRSKRDGALATFEAIAHALAVLEGPEISSRALTLFAGFVERHVEGHGLVAGRGLTLASQADVEARVRQPLPHLGGALRGDERDG